MAENAENDTPAEVLSAPPVKISDYRVVRSDANFVTFQVQTSVRSQDVSKLSWHTEEKDTEVAVEDGCLIFSGKQKSTDCTTARAFLKLSKNHQHKIVDIDKPPRGGLYVTVLKVGATNETPPPLDDQMTGRAPRRIIGPDGLDLPTSKGGLPGVPDRD